MPRGYKLALAALVLAPLVLAGIIFSPATVIERVHTVLYSPWFPVVLVGLYLVRSLLAWPITALAVLVGYRYGLVVGVPVALAGAAVSTFVPYAIVRYLQFDSGVLGRAADNSDKFFAETGDLRGLIAARVAPVPAEATSLAAGAAELRPSTFVLGTVIGEIPWAIAAVMIGHSMHQLSLSTVSISPWLILATIVATAVIIAGPIVRVVRRLA